MHPTPINASGTLFRRTSLRGLFSVLPAVPLPFGANVLKTKGYHREHNFGHGHHHLAMTLLTLNVLAFLFHTVLHLVDAAYQRIRQRRGTRKGFFQDIQTLTKYLLFDS